MTISENKVVTIDYTLKDKDKNVLDTSEGKTPLSYIHGKGQLIKGVENNLEGKKAGDTMKLEVQPSEGYGEYNPQLIAKIPRENIDIEEELQIGMPLQVQGEEGTQVVYVAKIEEKEVTLDGNHPLAGAVLFFDVTVKNVREATAEELDHGHVH
ncbi:MAG: peptidylprolyl isomerase [Spirochaetales bacterium]|nr:peptidylprolyl isomerase [Spirochaetales bacterium]